eukprot:scaffold44215_cov69-Phaeocystis_antarctica.AAC.11
MGKARWRDLRSATASPAPAACEASVWTASDKPMLTLSPNMLFTVEASEAGPSSAAPPCCPMTAAVTQRFERLNGQRQQNERRWAGTRAPQ